MGNMPITQELINLLESNRINEITEGMLQPHNAFDRREMFAFFAKNGHLEIMNRLIDLTIPEDWRNKMIHYGEDGAFRNSAENGHLEVMNRLIELTPDLERREAMIHSDGDYAFKWSAENAHLKIMNRLIELTPDPTQLSNMLHSDNNRAFRIKPAAEFLAVMSTNDAIFRSSDISRPLNEEKIAKLRELKGELIESMRKPNYPEDELTKKLTL